MNRQVLIGSIEAVLIYFAGSLAAIGLAADKGSYLLGSFALILVAAAIEITISIIQKQ